MAVQQSWTSYAEKRPTRLDSLLQYAGGGLGWGLLDGKLGRLSDRRSTFGTPLRRRAKVVAADSAARAGGFGQIACEPITVISDQRNPDNHRDNAIAVKLRPKCLRAKRV